MQRLADSTLTRLKSDPGFAGTDRVNTAAVKSFYPLFSGGKAESVAPCELRVSAEGGIFDFDAFGAMETALANPESIIERISSRALAGRGGSGYPVHKKWALAAGGAAREKWVVCNCAEGEPGTGKDHAILMNKPDAVLAGMAVCAAAVGAGKGVVYIRAGYEDAERKLREAVSEAGSRLGMKIEVFAGAGCYVCGEESGVLEAIEGRRGEPRLKPPYPVEAGLFGCPTVINNCESFACAAHAFSEGAAGYNKRLFTVSGCVERPGVYELDRGINLSGLLKVSGERPAAFAQVGGGASGTIVFADDFDCSAADTGTGAVIFHSSLNELAPLCLECLEFFAHESCGKCVPCRLGLAECADVLRALLSGGADGRVIAELKDASDYISMNAQCGLGQSACGAFMSALSQKPEIFTSLIKEDTPWPE